MTKRSLLTFSFASFLSCFLGFGSDSEFTSLFDGKSLKGWDGKEGAWEVRGGEIWCTGVSEGKNWLIWRGGKPANFVLRMECRWDSGNSGVQVRSDDLGDWQIFGYQVELAKQGVMGLWHHSLFPKNNPKRETRHFMALAGEKVIISKDGKKTVQSIGDGEKLKATFQEHKWNSLEIIADGNTLTQKINGQVFSVVVDDDSEMSRKSGLIALQDHGKGCKVAFRKIELKTLD